MAAYCVHKCGRDPYAMYPHTSHVPTHHVCTHTPRTNITCTHTLHTHTTCTHIPSQSHDPNVAYTSPDQSHAHAQTKRCIHHQYSTIHARIQYSTQPHALTPRTHAHKREYKRERYIYCTHTLRTPGCGTCCAQLWSPDYVSTLILCGDWLELSTSVVPGSVVCMFVLVSAWVFSGCDEIVLGSLLGS